MIHNTTSKATGDLLYLAFRAAYVTSFQQLADEFSPEPPKYSRGFLDHITLASGCAPQIQLEMLLKTWKRLAADNSEPLSAIDQCVCYCATCELAFFGETENRHRISRASNGPREMPVPDVIWLASKLRTVQITWPFPTDSALLLRDADFIGTELDQCRMCTPEHQAVSEVLQLVGEWQVSPQIVSNAVGLLTADEIRELGGFFQRHPRVMNL